MGYQASGHGPVANGLVFYSRENASSPTFDGFDGGSYNAILSVPH